jgi:EmrB/QacA subfamily drug resistance transporter
VVSAGAGVGLRYGAAAGRWVLLATVLGSGMAFLDATVVTVALPAIGRDLGAGAAGLQWVVNAYTLTLAGFILLGGSLGDRFGRRRVFLIGVVSFTVASVLCGLAVNITMLVVARAVQGIGGALLTPGSLAILQASFAPDDRMRAIGAWSGLAGVASAFGPLLGGWLVEVATWRLVFLINVPLALVVVLVTKRHVPESVDSDAVGRVDVAGAGLAVIGLGGVTYGLTEWSRRGPADPLVLTSLVLGAVALTAFVLVEGRTAVPMLPLALFRLRAFSAVNVVTFLVYAALSGVFFFLVVQLQVVAGFSPVAAGLSLLPLTLLMLALSARAGALANRIGPRIPMSAGPLLGSAGLAGLATVGHGATYWLDVLPFVVVLGLGLALTVAPLTATALAAVEDRHAGVASGVNNAVARTGSLLAIAILPVVSGVGASLTDPVTLAPAYRTAMLICAGLMAAGGVVALATVPSSLASIRAEVAASVGRPLPAPAEDPCRVHCAVGAPPLHPGSGLVGPTDARQA